MTHNKTHILLIGMGDLTMPIIEKAKNAGLKTICANRSATAKTLTVADEAVVLDGKNIEGFLDFVLKNNNSEKIIDVYTGSDLFLTVSNCRQALGINSLPIKAAYAVQNKTICKQIWSLRGINTPLAHTITKTEELYDIKNLISYPCVVKPEDANSSRGVKRCDSFKLLPEAIKTAKGYSNSGKVLIEPLLVGRLLDVNGYLHNDIFYPAGIVERWSGKPPYFAVNYGECPAQLTEKEEADVYDIIKKSANAVGITQGPVKADMILTDKGPYMFEVAPRFHGIIASLYLIPEALGIDAYKAYFEHVKTGVFRTEILEQKKDQIAVAKAIRAKSGKICGFNDLEKGLEIPGINTVILQKNIGSVIKHDIENNEDIIGYVIAAGANRENVHARISDFFSVFSVSVEEL